MAAREVVIGEINTPVGRFGAAITPEGLGCLTFPTESLDVCARWAKKWEPDAQVVNDPIRLKALEEQLIAYFNRDLKQFDVPLDMRGTPFQKEVWTALQSVAYGELRTYSQIASAIGRPSAVRAVGAANGANPIPVIVPCHRIIGSNGRLVGYGGGLPIKRQLLELEGVMAVF